MSGVGANRPRMKTTNIRIPGGELFVYSFSFVDGGTLCLRERRQGKPSTNENHEYSNIWQRAIRLFVQFRGRWGVSGIGANRPRIFEYLAASYSVIRSVSWTVGCERRQGKPSADVSRVDSHRNSRLASRLKASFNRQKAKNAIIKKAAGSITPAALLSLDYRLSDLVVCPRIGLPRLPKFSKLRKSVCFASYGVPQTFGQGGSPLPQKSSLMSAVPPTSTFQPMNCALEA